MFCSKCGSPNSESSSLCAKCGTPLARVDQSTATVPEARSVERAGADAALASITTEEFYKAAIGPHKQDYYLNKFARFDRGEARWSWNWPAFFVTLYWMIYRKMWLNALGYFALPYVIAVALAVAGAASGSDSLIGVGYVLFLAATFILPPMYGDALYHRHCRKKIDAAKRNASYGDDRSRLMAVAKSGGVSRVLMILGGILIAITMIGILAAVAIPAYQQYVKKARAVEYERSNAVLPIEQDEKGSAAGATL